MSDPSSKVQRILFFSVSDHALCVYEMQPGQNDPVSTEFRWFAVNGTPNLNKCDGTLTDKTCKSSESKKKNKKENYHES